MLYDVVLDGGTHRLELKPHESGWSCRLDNKDVHVDCALIGSDLLSVILDGKSFRIRRAGSQIFIGDRMYEVSVADPRSWRGRRAASIADSGARKLASSMPGKVVRLLAAEGDAIEEGQGVIVVEAMKMQNEIRSPKPGIIKKLLVREGMNVNAGEVLALVE
jgi:biotin carboxyl carrier protein